MTVMTRNGLNELDSLRREIDRTFEDFAVRRSPYSQFSFLPGKAARQYPLINVAEDHDNIYVEALAPGLDPESLNVTLQQRVLRIEGEKSGIRPEVKVEAFHRNERSAGKFVRTTTLSSDVNADKITANYRNGLLLITLPKSEEAKPKKISVNIS